MIVCPTNKKYFAKDDGTPLFFAGSYDMGTLLFGNVFWTPLLNAMNGKNNYLRVSVFGQDGIYAINTYLREAGSGKTASGYNDKFNLDKLNPKFFNQLKKFLIKAKECGVYVHLSLFNEIFIKHKPGWGFKRNFFGNGNHVNTSEVGDVDRDHNDDGTGINEFYDVQALKGKTTDPQRLAVAELQKKYMDTLLAIANQFDNVFLEIGNEVLAKSWVAYWVKYISTSSNLPITIPSESYSNTTLADGVCNHRVRYDYGSGYNILTGLDSDGDADNYNQVSPDFNRDAAWKTFMSGHGILANYAEGITRKTVGDKTFFSNDPNLIAQFNYFGLLQKFINESGLHMDLASPNNGIAGGLYCLANVGKQYVAYIGTKSSCAINLTGYDYKFRVKWYNSKNGSFSPVVKIKGGKVVLFTAPSVGYDVVFLDKVGV